MDVVGHDHERIQLHGEMPWNGLPGRLDHHARPVEADLSIGQIAQQAFGAEDADRHEVGARRGIVESGQPDRLAMVFVRIIADHLSSISPWGRGEASPSAAFADAARPPAAARLFDEWVARDASPLRFVRAAWMRSSRADAGSSFGSCGTSRPSKAHLRMDWRRRSARRRAISTCCSNSCATESRRSTSATMRRCSARGEGGRGALRLRTDSRVETWSRTCHRVTCYPAPE